MSIHKLYMSLLINFLVIQISYYGIFIRVRKFREDFYSRGFNFIAIFFTIAKIAKLKTREIKYE